MQKWYNQLTLGQRWLVYVVAALFPFLVLGVIDDGSTLEGAEIAALFASLAPIAVLVFLHLGSKK